MGVAVGFFTTKITRLHSNSLVILMLLWYLVCLDFPVFFFYLLQMLDQHIFNVVGHRTVFLCSQNTDLIKHFIRQTQSKYTFVGCRFSCPPFRV